MERFRAYCRDLVDRAGHVGWSVVTERAIPYGRMYVLGGGGGTETATLSCYHGKKGFKFVVGGKRADDLAGSLGGKAPQRAAAKEPRADPFDAGLPRIGADESGKGDYFGPLVVAAWWLEDGGGDLLRELRVADSKTLGDGAVERIAGRLEDSGHGAVLRLMPPEYNRRYAEVGNLNLLLADLHAACIRSLIERRGAHPRAVVVDQFARDTRRLASALVLPRGCQLVTRTKGEADPAVAAASLLARAEFLRGLRELSHEFGHEFAAGAGTPMLRSARAFVASFGRERLVDVAKVHFVTTQKL